MKETDDVAGQHELISESLTEKIWKELHLLHNELKTERRKVKLFTLYMLIPFFYKFLEVLGSKN